MNEEQLKKSGKNYIILRLGSVYGYSSDTARIDIMANHFAKTASQNGTLRLFAGGKQIKSLVPLVDVARCFKFMEERSDISNQLFNLTKDSVTVKEVAEKEGYDYVYEVTTLLYAGGEDISNKVRKKLGIPVEGK